ncbi:MAG: hypothetical protein NTW87_31610, partial [Planctomycetota bacterium]|nr:hypothetical protein [Planctomycetota bacterium]
TTCMLFFQALLLCGYAYAHASVSCLKPRAQAVVHVLLLLASLILLPAIPDASWKPTSPEAPAWRILALLATTVGLPFLLLSATGPLLQAWYSRLQWAGHSCPAPGASPYRLYALSNAASLLALLSYPFLVEPALPLKTQAGAWSIGYALFTLSCGWCALQLWRSAPALSAGAAAAAVDGDREGRPALTPADGAMCLALSACGSVMLLSTTSQLSQDVAIVPFLWILPLCLYLLTFVICFDNPRWYWRTLWQAALPLAVAGALAAPSFSMKIPLAVQVLVYCAVLFAGCMLCHGELARLKPGTRHLTRYYLLLAAGGAFGGIACSLIAPAVFTGLWEYQCGAEALCILTLLALVRDTHTKRPLKPLYAWGLVLGVAAAVGLGFIAEARSARSHTLVATRNFYGVLQVEEHHSDDGPLHSLVHGRITHGSHSMEQEQARGQPQQFDLLVLDAFNGGAAPLHLLTREAFALYDCHLRPNGVLAVNVSSHYLEIAPLIFGLAHDSGRQAVLIEDYHRRGSRYDSSRWVLVTRDQALLNAPEVIERAAPPPDPADWLRFTDDYSNLFQLLRRDTPPRAAGPVSPP